MPIRTILVVVDPSSMIETLLDAAHQLARRMEGHIEVLYLQPAMAELSAHFSHPEYPLPLDELEAVNQQSQQAMHTRFEAWRERQGMPANIVRSMLHSTFARWSCSDGSPVIGLLRLARLADVIVMTMQARVGLTATLVDAALFESGRPVLLIPAAVEGPLLERVAVAWNSSLEAVRGLTAAMPFLHEAERIEILGVAGARPADADPAMISIEDVVDALSWQGIQAGAIHVAMRDDEAVGAALLHEVERCGISLMALGAFTHGRISGAALGGVTGYMLEHSRIPLLMTH